MVRPTVRVMLVAGFPKIHGSLQLKSQGFFQHEALASVQVDYGRRFGSQKRRVNFRGIEMA